MLCQCKPLFYIPFCSPLHPSLFIFIRALLELLGRPASEDLKAYGWVKKPIPTFVSVDAHHPAVVERVQPRTHAINRGWWWLVCNKPLTVKRWGLFQLTGSWKAVLMWNEKLCFWSFGFHMKTAVTPMTACCRKAHLAQRLSLCRYTRLRSSSVFIFPLFSIIWSILDYKKKRVAAQHEPLIFALPLKWSLLMQLQCRMKCIRF